MLLFDEPDGGTRTHLRADLDATIARLIVRAAAKDWPIRADHCFLRIAYDNAVGARWDSVHARPAWRSMPLAVLEDAGRIARSIEDDGLATLMRLNTASLAHRRRA